jgi:hypothetical protein
MEHHDQPLVGLNHRLLDFHEQISICKNNEPIPVFEIGRAPQYSYHGFSWTPKINQQYISWLSNGVYCVREKESLKYIEVTNKQFEKWFVNLSERRNEIIDLLLK